MREWDLEKLKNELPELPEAKRHRFVQEFGFGLDQAGLLVEDRSAADYFENAASELKEVSPKTNYQTLFNYFTSDLKGIMNDKKTAITDIKITPEHLAHLVSLIEKGELSSRLAKDTMQKMFETGESPETLMKANGIKMVSGENELNWLIDEILAQNQDAVADYKKGKIQALQFLFGQAMALSKGQADPTKLRVFLEEKLK